VSRAAAGFDSHVFLNCPFDRQYEELFRGIIFCISYCGFRVRCALEVDDSAQVRIDRICRIIEECPYGIHDISRTEPDHGSGLPRFNMPLELGLFLGAKRYGAPKQRRKSCLILDAEPYRYQKFISDIAGQDIKSHANDARTAVRVVRDWLRSVSQRANLPGGAAVWHDYSTFRQEIPALLSSLHLQHDELTFHDYTSLVALWLKDRVVHGELQE
jgi:hypothetical protein